MSNFEVIRWRNAFDSSLFLEGFQKIFNNQRSILNVQGRREEAN